MTPGSRILLTGTVGPTIFGIAGPDNHNVDLKVRIDPLDQLVGVNHTSHVETTRHHQTFELVDFCRRLIAGDPACHELLWGDDLLASTAGEQLIEQRRLFLSKQLWVRYRQQIRALTAGPPEIVWPIHQTRARAAETGRRIRQAWHLVEHDQLATIGDRADIEWCQALAHVATRQRALYLDTIDDQIERLDQRVGRSTLPDTADCRPVDQLIYQLRVAHDTNIGNHVSV